MTDDSDLIEGGGFIIEKRRRSRRVSNKLKKEEDIENAIALAASDEPEEAETRPVKKQKTERKPRTAKKAAAKPTKKPAKKPAKNSVKNTAKNSAKKALSARKPASRVIDISSGSESSSESEYVPESESEHESEPEPEPELEVEPEVEDSVVPDSAADGNGNGGGDNDSSRVGEDSEAAAASTEAAPKPKKTRKAKGPKKPRKKIDYFRRFTESIFKNHPDLAEVFLRLKESAKRPVCEAPQPKNMDVMMLPFQLEGLHWLQQQEDSEFNGGILADEMGMGKTVQTIGLFMSDTTKRPNLVVAPAVAVMQWKSEIEQHSAGQLKAYVYHGSSRTNSKAELLEYDVILTTYAVLESVFRKEKNGFKRNGRVVKEKSLLHSVDFYRVVLDEAHCIKDRQSGTARSVNNLKCQKRWCLSGTPLQNRIGEMYSLIRFMQLEPFSMYFCTRCDCRSTEWNFVGNSACFKCGCRPMQHTSFFNHFFLKNIVKYGISQTESQETMEQVRDTVDVVLSEDTPRRGPEAFARLQLLLSRIMLRRTKEERSDDLGLPPKSVEIRYDLFNPEEKDLYQSLYMDVNRQFSEYVEEGVVLNNYANIFTLITRMRQIADHPDLVVKKLHKMIEDSGSLVCQLCDDEAEDAIESKCHHKFCRLCISEYIESFDEEHGKLQCPVCHIGLVIDLEAAPLEVKDEESVHQGILSKINMARWKSSTKIEALVEELYKSRSKGSTLKSIVYSQFTSFLDIIDWRLKRAGFKTVRLQGSMSPQQRASTISYFMNNVEVEVFLVSLKAGGVALNLTEASQIFIMDPWWNPAVEWQCDRVHRILQMRPVRIVKFCIADSIEKKIMELQDKKADMVNATVGGDEKAVNRLTPADLQFLFSS